MDLQTIRWDNGNRGEAEKLKQKSIKGEVGESRSPGEPQEGKSSARTDVVASK